jgi:hypothetical protein
MMGASWTSPASAQAPTADAGPVLPPSAPIGISGSLSNYLQLRGNTSESTLDTLLNVEYAWTRSFSTFVGVASVYNESSGLESATELANPTFGVNLRFEVTKHLTLGAQSGLMPPIGTGGGDTPSPAAQRALMNSIDWGGTMYAVNHLDLFNGVHADYSIKKLNLQFETTLHELLRVRGQNADPVGRIAAMTWTTATVSYAFFPALSLSTVFSQNFVWNTPTYVAMDPNARADHYFSAGVSTVVNLAGVELSPGFVYSRALDLPLSGQGFQVAELDVGFSL